MTPNVQTNDFSFFYLTQAHNIQGNYKLALSSLTQGALTMLIYRNPDFTDLAKVREIFVLDEEFNRDFDDCFSDMLNLWSAVIIGEMRFSTFCSSLDNIRVQS